MNPVTRVRREGPSAGDLNRVRPGASKNICRRKIQGEAGVALDAFLIEHRSDARRIFETNDDVVRPKTFTIVVHRRANPRAAPDQIETQAQAGELIGLRAVQKKVNAIGLVTIGQSPFPRDVRLLIRHYERTAQTIESIGESSGTVKIIICCRIVRGDEERITGQSRDLAGLGVIDVILGSKFIGGIVTRSIRIGIFANLPNGQQFSPTRGQA